MTQNYKQCPRCSHPAPLFVGVCTKCGHQYTTQFATQQTQMVTPSVTRPKINRAAFIALAISLFVILAFAIPNLLPVSPTNAIWIYGESTLTMGQTGWIGKNALHDMKDSYAPPPIPEEYRRLMHGGVG